MRIAIAGFLHESNTFSTKPTTLREFKEANLQYGADLIPVWRDAHHEVGGFIQGGMDEGFEIVPLLMAEATPGGPLTSETYEFILDKLRVALNEAGPLDGLLLGLHGAMVCESFDSADGETVRRLRAQLGPDFPIVVSYDLHGNVSPPMVEAATAVVAYRSYPHIDQRDRGRECAAIIRRVVEGKIRPTQSYRKPPLLLHIVQQYSEAGAMGEIIAEVRRLAVLPGVVSASFLAGYIYADVPVMGPTTLVVTDGDQALADRLCDGLNDFVWARREALNAKLPDPASAVRQAAANAGGPVCLMDCGDNIGGGGPGDSTILFEEIIRQGLRDAAIVLHDPENVERCVAAGVRASIKLAVGGKTPGHGDPVPIEGIVRLIHDGRFIEPEPRHGGKRFFDQGITAMVETTEGHQVVLNSYREVPMSLHQILSLGIRPETRKVIVVKGVTAPRAAYGPVAAEIIPVDTPGITAAGPEEFVYHKRPRPLFPLDQA